jgi:hypothetical protein
VLLRNPLAALGQDGARANPALDFQLPYEATTNPVFYFTRATFEPYVGGVFSAPGVGGGRVQLRLVGISDYEPSPATRLTTRPRRRTNCFALQFRAAGQLRQLTTIHGLEHGALGRFDLFMTESQAGGAHFYEAVINHVAQS